MIVVITDDGWTLASNAWTIGGDPHHADETFLSYFWGQEGKSQAWNVKLYRPVVEVLELIGSHAAEGICDLRELQNPPAPTPV